MIRVVIFDRDGVLANFDLEKAKTYFESQLGINIEDITSHWLTWGEMNGYPKSIEEEKIYFIDFWEYLSDQCKVSPEVKAELLKFHYPTLMFAYPEVKKVLETLRENNIKVGVLSNFSLASLEMSLEHLGIIHLIDVAHAAVVIGYSKPHPKSYTSITDRLGIKPEECLFFDDELPNVHGAEAVGMKAYLVDRKQPDHDFAQHRVCNLLPVFDLVKKQSS